MLEVLIATAYSVVGAAVLSTVADLVSVFHGDAVVEERLTDFDAGALVASQARAAPFRDAESG